MEITNRVQARQYVAEWRAGLLAGQPAVGHRRCAHMFRMAAEGMTRCAAICRSQGRKSMLVDYLEAAEELGAARDFHQQQADCEDAAHVDQIAEAIRLEDARIMRLRESLGLGV